MTLGGLFARRIYGGTNMNQCPATERLAEFIDGTLAPDARERVAEHLGDCADCYAVVAESLSISDELVARARARRKRYLFYSVPASLAAAAILLLVFKTWKPAHEFTATPEREVASQAAPAVTKLLPMPRSEPMVAGASSFASELSNRLTGKKSAALLARIPENHGMSQATYGFSSVVSPEKSAFRIGVCIVDLEVALKAKSKERTDAYMQQLIELLKPIEPLHGPLPAIIALGSSGKEASRISSAVESLFKNKKESVYVHFGSWVEASRLAAEGQNAAFFQPAEIKGFKNELEKSGAPIGTMRNLSQFDGIISSDRVQTDEFTTIARLLADIKEMY